MTKVVFPASELVPNTANGFIDVYSKGYMHHEDTKDMKLYIFFVFFVSFVVNFLFFNTRKTVDKPSYGLLILDRKTHMAFIQAFEIVADAD